MRSAAASSISGRSGRTSDQKSTRLNSSHRTNSYAVFCLKKKTVTVEEKDAVRKPRLGVVDEDAPQWYDPDLARDESPRPSPIRVHHQVPDAPLPTQLRL